jgi:3,4-dihydroxy 2-butanone 4-phosphate synthase
VDDVIQAVNALRQGRFILVYDGDGREEETDLTVASQFVTPAAIRTLRKDAGGLICVTLSGDVHRKIGLPLMADVLRDAGRTYPILEAVSAENLKYDRHSTFSLTVNHKDTYTGITDKDRSLTISRLAAIAGEAVKRENGWAAHVFADEFRAPGHVPVLNAAEPLLEARRGHTELTTALMLMAGLTPSATICEMMADDDRARTRNDAKAYARDHNLVFLEGQDIVRAWQTWSA